MVAKVQQVELIKPPDNTPEYLYDAWYSCVHWALGEPDIVAAFRRDTGILWNPGKSGIERMIDKATMADHKFIVAFVAWVNENVWGNPNDIEDSDL